MEKYLSSFKDMLKDLNKFVEQLCDILPDCGLLKDQSREILKSVMETSDLASKATALKPVLETYGPEHLRKLYALEEEIILMNTRSSTHQDESTITVPIKVQISSDSHKTSAQKFKDCRVILGSRHLIVNRGQEIFIWPLESIWIGNIESEQLTIEVIVPEIAFTLKAGKKEYHDTWKFALYKAINALFILPSENPEHESINKWDKRHLKHKFYFGQFENYEYSGEWFLGKPHGVGVLWFPNPSICYSGEMKNGLITGLGTLMDETHPGQKVVIRQGIWRDGKMEGFGMSDTFMKMKDTMTFYEDAPTFIGNWKSDELCAYGIEVTKETIYIGKWTRHQKNGEARIINYMKNKSYNIVECSFEKGILQTNHACIWGPNFTFNGQIDIKLCPSGQGCYINTKCGHKLEGNIVKKEGSLEIKGVMTEADNPKLIAKHDHIFEDKIGAEAISADVLGGPLHMCLSAVLNESNSLDKNVIIEKLRKLLVSEEEDKIESFECTIETLLSSYSNVIENNEFSLPEWNNLEILFRRLCEIKAFPLSVLIDTYCNLLMNFATLEIGDVVFLQRIVIEYINNMILQTYSFLRYFLPGMPENVLEKIRVRLTDETRTGLDLVYASLKPDIYCILMKIFNNPCEKLDKQFRKRFPGGENTLTILNILSDRNFSERLKTAIPILDERPANDDNISFDRCRELLKKICPDSMMIDTPKDAFAKLQELHDLLDCFDRVIQENQLQDERNLLLSCLICKARPSRFGFLISVLEKYTSHRSSNDQKQVLRRLHEAYTNCCFENLSE